MSLTPIRVCGFDLETTGLDIEKDKIVELAFVIKEIGDPRPLVMESQYVYDESYGAEPMPEEATAINGITNRVLVKCGIPLGRAVANLCAQLLAHQVDYVVAHNGENFDKPFLLRKLAQLDTAEAAECARIVAETPWLDTRMDIEFPRSFTSHRLGHVSAYLGFLNPFPHAALFDVMTTLRVLESFDVLAVIERSKQPWLTIRAMVEYADREKAKARRFSWEKSGDRTYTKCWVKRIKACDLEKETKDAAFEVRVID